MKPICILLLLSLLVGACSSSTEKKDNATEAALQQDNVAKADTLTPKQATDLRKAITAYMECEECENKELAGVVRFGQAAVSTLAAILDKGPSEAKRDLHEQHLRQVYADRVAYQRTHPDTKAPESETAYVQLYLANYEALYQSRAATALGEIGGDEARKALSQPVGNKREDVKTAIQQALDKLK